jgi:hypothetical protein
MIPSSIIDRFRNYEPRVLHKDMTSSLEECRKLHDALVALNSRTTAIHGSYVPPDPNKPGVFTCVIMEWSGDKHTFEDHSA